MDCNAVIVSKIFSDFSTCVKLSGSTIPHVDQRRLMLWIGIKMENRIRIRIRIDIKTMLIHNIESLTLRYTINFDLKGF